MKKSNFYKEIIKGLDIADGGRWGWVNLSDADYKNLDIERKLRERDSKNDTGYSAEQKALYVNRLKVRFKRLLYIYAKTLEKETNLTEYEIGERLKKMGEVCDDLLVAYRKAASGERSSAIDLLYGRLEKTIQLSDFSAVYEDIREKERSFRKGTREEFETPIVNLYRVRATEKYELFDQKGLSHIPFDLAHKTSNERYSICGLPTIYLASSVYCCWVEMNCPRVETMNVALYNPNLDVKFLDLCFPDEHAEYNEQTNLLLPIIVACDMPVKYPNDNYKYEYTIPQLILECLVKYRNHKMPGRLLGIRYQSVKRLTTELAYPFSKFKRLYYNYVFPPVEIKDEGQCPVIGKNFSFVKATSCFNMENIEKQVPIIKLYQDYYENGLFFKIENHLKLSAMLTYDSVEGALKVNR